MTVRVVGFVAALATATASAQQVGGPAVRQAGPASPPPGAAGAQPASTAPNGLILGRVIDATTSRPIARATVFWTGGASGLVMPAGSTRVLTDSQGRFVLRDLPKGAVSITATKPGYVSGAWGKLSPIGTGQPIELAEGERRGDVTILVWKFGAIGGRVTDEADEAMPGVQVRLLRRAIVAGQWRLLPTSNQNTDDRGIYRIDSLVPGQYVVGVVSTMAAAPVEVYDAYIQAFAAGAPTEFSRSIDPSASLSSAPAFRVGDQVLFPSASAPGVGAAQSQTARPQDEVQRMFVYPTVFYPSVPTVTQADVVTLGAGSERTNIDFQLQPAPSVAVSGSVVGPDGPSANTALQLLPASADILQREYGFEAATTMSDRRGAFRFVGVVPGQYVIRVIRTPQRPQSASSGITTVVQVGSTTITSFSGTSAPLPIPNEPTLWGSLSVSTGQTDVSGLSVILHPGARLAGRVEFSGNAEKPTPAELAQLNVAVDASDGRVVGSTSASSIIARLQVDAEGQVHSYQLPAGKYVVGRTGSFPGWTFAGAFLDGKDVSTMPFDSGDSGIEGLVLKYTDRRVELSGTVRDDGRAPERAASVLLFPADPRGWTEYGPTPRRFRSITTSVGGAYSFSGVAAGEYFVVAAGDNLPPDWQDVDVLKRLVPLATRVMLTEGDKKVQDLKVSSLR